MRAWQHRFLQEPTLSERHTEHRPFRRLAYATAVGCQDEVQLSQGVTGSGQWANVLAKASATQHWLQCDSPCEARLPSYPAAQLPSRVSHPLSTLEVSLRTATQHTMRRERVKCLVSSSLMQSVHCTCRLPEPGYSEAGNSQHLSACISQAAYDPRFAPTYLIKAASL